MLSLGATKLARSTTDSAVRLSASASEKLSEVSQTVTEKVRHLPPPPRVTPAMLRRGLYTHVKCCLQQAPLGYCGISLGLTRESNGNFSSIFIEFGFLF